MGLFNRLHSVAICSNTANVLSSSLMKKGEVSCIFYPLNALLGKLQNFLVSINSCKIFILGPE